MSTKKAPARKKTPAKPRSQPKRPADEALDGCTGVIPEKDATPDEDLPAAEGGVASHGF
jgi:hypothetical protein